MGFIKKTTYLVLMAGALSMGITDSFAASRLMKAPVQEFKVADVSAIGQDRKFCTVNTHYPDGLILTFSKNNQGTYAMALDFQARRFADNRKIIVTIEPDSDFYSRYTVEPLSSSALIVALGNAQGLMDYIAANESLDVDVGSKNSLSLKLPLLKLALEELDQCLGLAPMIAQKVAPPSLPDADVPEDDRERVALRAEIAPPSGSVMNTMLDVPLPTAPPTIAAASQKDEVFVLPPVSASSVEAVSVDALAQDTISGSDSVVLEAKLGSMQETIQSMRGLVGDLSQQNSVLRERVTVLQNKLASTIKADETENLSVLLDARTKKLELLSAENEKLRVALASEKQMRAAIEAKFAALDTPADEGSVTQALVQTHMNNDQIKILSEQLAALQLENDGLKARMLRDEKAPVPSLFEPVVDEKTVLSTRPQPAYTAQNLEARTKSELAKQQNSTKIASVVEERPVIKAPKPSISANAIKTLVQDTTGLLNLDISGNLSAYQWDAPNHYGSWQQRDMGPASFTQMTSAYLSDAKESCSGDFAALPSKQSGDLSTYEIACIDPVTSASQSAAVILYQKSNEFIAVTLETDLERMPDIINLRDEMAVNLSRGHS